MQIRSEFDYSTVKSEIILVKRLTTIRRQEVILTEKSFMFNKLLIKMKKENVKLQLKKEMEICNFLKIS